MGRHFQTVKPNSRESDERILRTMTLRFEGLNTTEIAERWPGYERGAISRDHKAVLEADRDTPDLSHQPCATVAQAYPWARL